MASRIVIVLAAALCSPAALAQMPLTERCDRAPGLEKVLAQWHGELERVRGEKFLLPATPAIETDCVQRRVLFPRWWKTLNGVTAQKALVEPSAQSVADCRRLVGTLAQWQELLYELPGNPKLSSPTTVACGAQRGGSSAPSPGAPPAAPVYRPGRIP
jgi:hypothetical protein